MAPKPDYLAVIRQIFVTNENNNQDRDIRQMGLSHLQQFFEGNGQVSSLRAEFPTVTPNIFESLYDDHTGVASQSLRTVRAFIATQPDEDVAELLGLILRDYQLPESSKTDSQRSSKAIVMAHVLTYIHPVLCERTKSVREQVIPALAHGLHSPMIEVIGAAITALNAVCAMEAETLLPFARDAANSLITVVGTHPIHTRPALVALGNIAPLLDPTFAAQSVLPALTSMTEAATLPFATAAVGRVAAAIATTDSKVVTDAVKHSLGVLATVADMGLDLAEECIARAAALECIAAVAGAVPRYTLEPVLDAISAAIREGVSFDPLAAEFGEFSETSDDESDYSAASMSEASDAGDMDADTDSWRVRLAAVNAAAAVAVVTNGLLLDALATGVQDANTNVSEPAASAMLTALPSIPAHALAHLDLVAIASSTDPLASKIIAAAIRRGAPIPVDPSRLVARAMVEPDVEASLVLLWGSIGTHDTQTWAAIAEKSATARGMIAATELLSFGAEDDRVALIGILLAAIAGNKGTNAASTAIAGVMDAMPLRGLLDDVLPHAIAALAAPTPDLLAAAGRLIQRVPDVASDLAGPLATHLTGADSTMRSGAVDAFVSFGAAIPVAGVTGALLAYAQLPHADPRILPSLATSMAPHTTMTGAEVSAVVGLLVKLIEAERDCPAVMDVVSRLASCTAVVPALTNAIDTAVKRCATITVLAAFAKIRVMITDPEALYRATMNAMALEPGHAAITMRFLMERDSRYATAKTLDALLSKRVSSFEVVTHIANAAGLLVSFKPDLVGRIPETCKVMHVTKKMSSIDCMAQGLSKPPDPHAFDKEDEFLRHAIHLHAAKAAVSALLDRDAPFPPQIEEYAKKALELWKIASDSNKTSFEGAVVAIFTAFAVRGLATPAACFTDRQRIAVTLALFRRVPDQQHVDTVVQAVHHIAKTLNVSAGLDSIQIPRDTEFLFIHQALGALTDMARAGAAFQDPVGLWQLVLLIAATLTRPFDDHVFSLEVKTLGIEQQIDASNAVRVLGWSTLGYILATAGPDFNAVLDRLEATIVPFVIHNIALEGNPDVISAAVPVLRAMTTRWAGHTIALARAIGLTVKKSASAQACGMLVEVAQKTGAAGHVALAEAVLRWADWPEAHKKLNEAMAGVEQFRHRVIPVEE
ncbi:hypothetical protein J8273_0367 [Carpediemonas membranifera]|uniref:Uncharacterized protein n=1 Tax=Carpediemonas membranifera TaxID=201153 RepID=A0A8J6B3V4_9EUKA|nr:hypothetical protein J8273_0367 [Carpediemonas membranifera]|eukprot:KAG9395148.1 hypothetical protein J8273_0367 [Carpediemonas membranifera]